MQTCTYPDTQLLSFVPSPKPRFTLYMYITSTHSHTHTHVHSHMQIHIHLHPHCSLLHHLLHKFLYTCCRHNRTQSTIHTQPCITHKPLHFTLTRVTVSMHLRSTCVRVLLYGRDPRVVSQTTPHNLLIPYWAYSGYVGN